MGSEMCIRDRSLSVERVSNPYFEDLRHSLAEFSEVAAMNEISRKGLNVLFACEPLSEHALQEFGDLMYWGYTEFDALRYFFSHLSLLDGPIHEVVIRPHPAERVGKYNAIILELQEMSGISVRLGGGESLLQEIVRSDVVVGCETMAMVVGLIADRRVISAIPPGGSPCSLPHSQIESLKAMVDAGSCL